MSSAEAKEPAMNRSRQRSSSQVLRAAAALAVFAVFIGSSDAHSQEATERFIPIGRSPGLSGKVTTIGAIQALQGRVLTLSSERGPQRIDITDRTVIWVDRSQQKLSNAPGGLADLKPGRRVEVKPDAKNKSAAEWIKVEAAGN
jgi:hypothetical protein